MISLPSLRRLDVDNFGLYPGTHDNPGLHVEFRPGLTLALGANGLGKTTLVTMIYRMLTGPREIPKLAQDGDLGSPGIQVRELNRVERSIFANRVVDGARSARTALAFRLGGADLNVVRRLDTLALTGWSVNGRDVDADENAYAATVLERAGVSSFSDWILALRHLVFYFEDRRALVWDPSAQRQLLRFLFLPPDQALEWRKQEREVLSRDSLVRNLTWQRNREATIVRKAREAAAQGTVADVRDRLALLAVEQQREETRLQDLNDGLAVVVAERQDARVAALHAEQAHESSSRGVERLQLDLIDSAFPTATATARYVLGQILADTECLVCSTAVPRFRAQVEARIRGHECPVCGSPVAHVSVDGDAPALALAVAIEQVRTAGVQRDTAIGRREEAEKLYAALLDEVSGLNDRIARRSAEMSEMVRRLPPDEQKLRAHQTELASLGSRLEQGKRELETYRGLFDAFVQDVNHVISERKDAIKETFDSYAKAFLVETAALVWQPRRERVGQSGSLVEFPAFALDMSAPSFESPVRRTGPDTVSESQREFIDLSFRMALMEVASEGGATLVVDAPESSLDAVFSTRASDVLTKFSQKDGNRLVITSNLVDGDLIPKLLGQAGVTSAEDPRVIDLLSLAAPTAATSLLAVDYDRAKSTLFSRTETL